MSFEQIIEIVTVSLASIGGAGGLTGVIIAIIRAYKHVKGCTIDSKKYAQGFSDGLNDGQSKVIEVDVKTQIEKAMLVTLEEQKTLDNKLLLENNSMRKALGKVLLLLVKAKGSDETDMKDVLGLLDELNLPVQVMPSEHGTAVIKGEDV